VDEDYVWLFGRCAGYNKYNYEMWHISLRQEDGCLDGFGVVENYVTLIKKRRN